MDRSILKPLTIKLARASELVVLARAARAVARASRVVGDHGPVLFFNASTRLSGLSQNAGFSLLASWMFRLAGIPVVHFVCDRGMARCVLGTDEMDPSSPMPCGMCIRQSRVTFLSADVRSFGMLRDEALAAAIQSLDLDELLRFEYPLPGNAELSAGLLPLGALVLPSLRWRLRLQSLVNDAPTRFLCREFMLSAWNIACHLLPLLEDVKPQAAVLFNGTHFPEATAAWLCRQRGIRVITHESGFQPFSGYFVEGQATRYPIIIPDIELSPQQEARLDADLQKRWKGDFSMAGVKFWSEINGLPDELAGKAGDYDQVVSIFTNVIFDTTQMYANVVFKDMFAWLDEVLEIIRRSPQTLFVLRAHPDEARPGKTSRESVAMWFEEKATQLANIIFIPPQKRVSSYDLVKISKFILVYNSTIGLESILLGVPALAAGQAPFNDFDTVFFEPDRQAYLTRLASWLKTDRIEIPPEKQSNTRRFLYYRTYRFSLPFGEFLESTHPTGYVRLRKFTPERLARSPTSQALLDGLANGKRFELNV